MQFRLNILNLQTFFEDSHVCASSHHGDYRPSEGPHTTAWFCCLHSASLSSSEGTGKAAVILSSGDFTQTVEGVKAVTAYHVFFVAGKPVVGHSVACVKGILDRMVFTLGDVDSNGV